MPERTPGPTCSTRCGPDHIDCGTMCLSRSCAPGPIGAGREPSYDVGSIHVHISRIRHNWDSWPEIQERGRIYEGIGGLIRHRSAPGNVRRLINESNLRRVFQHILTTLDEMRHTSVDTEIHYEFHRNSEGVVSRITFRAPQFLQFEPEQIEAPRPETLEDMLRRRILPILRSTSGNPAARMACCVQKIISLPRLDDAYLTLNLVNRLYEQPTNPSNRALHLRRSLERYFLTIQAHAPEERPQLIADYLIETDQSIFRGLHQAQRLQTTGSGQFIVDWIRERQENPNSIYNCYGAP